MAKHLVTITLEASYDNVACERLKGFVHVDRENVLPLEIELWGPRGSDRRTQGWADLRPEDVLRIQLHQPYAFTELGFKRATVRFHLAIVARPGLDVTPLLRAAEDLLGLTEPLSPEDPRIV